MPAPFPPWSDTVLRVWLVVIVLALVVGVCAPLVYMRTAYGTGQMYEIDQPVQFDHRHHVGDDGIDCRVCHTRVEKSARAGLPSTDVCYGCHNQVWANSPMTEPIRRSYWSGKPMPWNSVHELPRHVYFNHSIHVQKGVGCVTCHGRIDTMPLVRQVAPLTMGWCIECHRNPEPHLRPLDRITDLTWVQPSAETGRELAAQYGTRHLTHCTTCHR